MEPDSDGKIDISFTLWCFSLLWGSNIRIFSLLFHYWDLIICSGSGKLRFGWKVIDNSIQSRFTFLFINRIVVYIGSCSSVFYYPLDVVCIILFLLIVKLYRCRIGISNLFWDHWFEGGATFVFTIEIRNMICHISILIIVLGSILFTVMNLLLSHRSYQILREITEFFSLGGHNCF